MSQPEKASNEREVDSCCVRCAETYAYYPNLTCHPHAHVEIDQTRRCHDCHHKNLVCVPIPAGCAPELAALQRAAARWHLEQGTTRTTSFRARLTALVAVRKAQDALSAKLMEFSAETGRKSRKRKATAEPPEGGGRRKQDRRPFRPEEEEPGHKKAVAEMALKGRR